MARLFLSYRRSDTGAYADRLAARLADFQFDAVFQDREDIELSSNYADEIRAALSDSDAVLVLIGRGWTSAQDRSGARRLDDPSDWVRREIALAIGLGVPIVPVLFDTARTPAAVDMPSDLAPLATAQGYDVNGNYFDRDADDLARRVERLVVSRRRGAPDRRASNADAFLNQLLGICIALFVITLTTSVLPSFVPAFSPYFWPCPGLMTVTAFAWWAYLRGESLRLRTRTA